MDPAVTAAVERVTKYVEWLESPDTSPYPNMLMADIAVNLRLLLAEVQQLKSQLPEGMKNCTILCKECDKGHSWLTATNWIQHGCPHCEKQALLAEVQGNSWREGQGIYVASRVKHAPLWQKFRTGFPIISTWIDEAGEGESDDMSELWSRIEREIRGCKVLVFFAAAEDMPLKGAYIEAGMAIAMGKPVYVVLDMMLEPRSLPPIGSWLNHPLVKQFKTIGEALSTASRHVPYKPEPTEQPTSRILDADSTSEGVGEVQAETKGQQRREDTPSAKPGAEKSPMNICEALKAGRVNNRAIRQRGWPKETYAYHGMDNLIRWSHTDEEISFAAATLLTEDWELADAPYHSKLGVPNEAKPGAEIEDVSSPSPDTPSDVETALNSALVALQLAATDMTEWRQLAKRQYDEMAHNAALCPTAAGIASSEEREKHVYRAIRLCRQVLEDYDIEDVSDPSPAAKHSAPGGPRDPDTKSEWGKQHHRLECNCEQCYPPATQAGGEIKDYLESQSFCATPFLIDFNTLWLICENSVGTDRAKILYEQIFKRFKKFEPQPSPDTIPLAKVLEMVDAEIKKLPSNERNGLQALRDRLAPPLRKLHICERGTRCVVKHAGKILLATRHGDWFIVEYSDCQKQVASTAIETLTPAQCRELGVDPSGWIDSTSKGE